MYYNYCISIDIYEYGCLCWYCIQYTSVSIVQLYCYGDLFLACLQYLLSGIMAALYNIFINIFSNIFNISLDRFSNIYLKSQTNWYSYSKFEILDTSFWEIKWKENILFNFWECTGSLFLLPRKVPWWVPYALNALIIIVHKKEV